MNNTSKNKMDWFGIVPKDWDYMPLKRRFTFGKGLSITKADLIESGNAVLSYGQIHAKDNPKTFINDNIVRYVSKSTIGNSNDSLAVKNGFIFADTSEDLEGCGNCNYVDRDDVYGGYHTIVLKPNKYFTTNYRYLGYLFQTDAWRYQLRTQLTEVKVFSISQKSLKSTWIVIPPENIAKAIVSYLDNKSIAIDEAIDKHRKLIDKIEDYKRAYIIFAVNGIRHNRSLKPSDIAWMPQIPEDWKILPLRYVFGERKNENIGMIEKNLLTLSYGKIKRKDINANEGLLPESFEGYNIIEKGDIVLRLLDLQNDWNSLRTGLVTERGIITSAYVTLYPLKKLNSEYFRYLLHSYDLKKVFYTMGEGIRQSLKYDDIARGFLLPIPSMEEQEEIVNAIKAVESKADVSIARHQQIIEKLEEYRKSIIYNAVTGKIDCRKENIKNGI